MKVFLDKKIELRSTMDFIHKQYQKSFEEKERIGSQDTKNADLQLTQADMKLFDYADRLREYFPNLALKENDKEK